MPKPSLLPRAAAFGAALVLPLVAADSACAATASASATTRNGGGPESTPIDLGGASGHATRVGGSGSIVRTIVGLAIVIGVIYGVAWVLKQLKKGREGKSTGAGLATVASVPLGANRSVHLVRAGCELVLVGVAEQGVTPIRTYTIAEAQAAGLIDEDGDALPPLIEGGATSASARRPRPRLQLPRLELDTLRAWTVRQ